MFGLFSKKSEKEKLKEKYRKLLERSYKASKINRRESDELIAEAKKIEEQLEEMDKTE